MPDNVPETLDLELNLKLGPHPVQARITLPAGATRPRVMLPIFRGLSDTVVQLGEKETAEKGLSITCAKGCGACCRQVIPISQTEAYELAELVAAMPPDQRQRVVAKIKAARLATYTAGLSAWLEHPEKFEPHASGMMGLEYFKLGIACPFLEDESCSIHADRPMVCREYLVTSPAARCGDVETRSIQRVAMWGSVASAVTCIGLPDEESVAHWVPLILLMDWVEKNPEPADSRTGQEIFREVMHRLWGKSKDEAPKTSPQIGG